MRERIIQAAIESFGQTGFDRTKMDDIAKRLGLSKGTIYLYFKSKEDLFLAICEHNLRSDPDNPELFTDREKVASDAEQIYDTIRRNEREMDKVTLEMIVESTRNPRLKKLMLEHHEMVYDHVVAQIKRRADEGFIGKDVDVNSLCMALMALFDGLTVNRMLGVSEAANKKAWVTMVSALIAGTGRN